MSSSLQPLIGFPDCISIGTRNAPESASWRIVVGVGILWALILGIGILFMPESPRLLSLAWFNLTYL